MSFRRLLRRRKPPPFDLTALDRLEHQIARVIALVPQVEPEAQPVAQPQPERLPAGPPAEQAARPAPVPTAAHLLFLPGYELVERRGAAPEPGARLEHEGAGYVVLRHGPSPLPGDRRRCVFLEAP